MILKANNEDNLAKVLKHNTAESKHEAQCLINLEDLTGTNQTSDQVAVSIDQDETQLSTNNPFRGDDTFTQLATRSQPDTTTNRKLLVIPTIPHYNVTTLDDSGEFAVPASANSEDVNKSFKFPLTGDFSGMVTRLDTDPLPTPVEVISIKDEELSKSHTEGINESLNISGDHSRNPFLNDESLTEPNIKDILNLSNGHSNNENTNSFGNLGDIKEEDKETKNFLIPAKSEPHILKTSNQQLLSRKKIDDVVNMDLVDASFTPYKKKCMSNGHILQDKDGKLIPEDLPKMKIFLPKNNDDSDEDDDDDSDTDDDKILTSLEK